MIVQTTHNNIGTSSNIHTAQVEEEALKFKHTHNTTKQQQGGKSERTSRREWRQRLGVEQKQMEYPLGLGLGLGLMQAQVKQRMNRQ